MAAVVLTEFPGEGALESMVPLIERDLSEPYSLYTYLHFTSTWPQMTFLVRGGRGAARRGRPAVVGERGMTRGARKRAQAVRLPADDACAEYSVARARDAAKGDGGEPVGGAEGEGRMWMGGKWVFSGDAAVSAWRRGEVVGCAISKAETTRRGSREGYLGMIVVDPACRGMGIGRALADVTVAAMLRERCSVAILEVEYANLGARSLYESMGFVRDRRNSRYYLNGSDAFHMILRLPTASPPSSSPGGGGGGGGGADFDYDADADADAAAAGAELE
jgi:ribosomal protein S18 acetylase RimI-like enzyme